MGFSNLFFKSNSGVGELTYEIVERQISIDDQKYKVRIRKAGREYYAEEIFRGAQENGDLTFSRFLMLDENPVLPHFAPSLKETVDWFTGRKQPKDGYNTIWWGERVTFACNLCQAKRVVPLRIAKMERLTVVRSIPEHREIVGWRVVEVESELTGRGIPTKKSSEYKTLPVLKWDKFPNQYLCRNCAEKLAAAGRESEIADYFVFGAGRGWVRESSRPLSLPA
jgi:hypothetical protein